MSKTKKGEQPFYKRNLPHWQPNNVVLFITARLDGSLPKWRIQELKERMEGERLLLKNKGLTKDQLANELKRHFDLYFGKFDQLLDGSTTGPHWLKEDVIAYIWTNALEYFDGKRYQLICSTVMSNHVHFIFHHLKYSLSKTMHSLKSYTGSESNKVLKRKGKKFWQYESFDRMIRDTEELEYRINYVINNPVEAGLIANWKEWKYNYIHPDYLSFVKE